MDSLKRFFLTKKTNQKRLGEDRIMDSLICFFFKYFLKKKPDYGFIRKSLKQFFSNKKKIKFKKGWEKIGLCMDSLKRCFFSNKKLLKFKKGWEKIGGFPYLFFFK